MTQRQPIETITNNREQTPAKTGSFKERVAQTKTTRWVRFGIVVTLFLLWVLWLGNPWVLLLLPLLFDIYITGYIPFTWWKHAKSPVVRYIMGWVDAIVYALILVYMIYTFIGQNYRIPSSSLEKSLLVGDYLVVNKMAYGPRVPNTPIHLPLVQHTLPLINTKSYVEWPRWRYHRLKGYTTVQRGDIVVFNFPAGDTVATKVPNPDYYTLVQLYGRDRVHADKNNFGDIIYRPVDRRENYVKRAIGLPGETLSIVDGVVHIDGKAIEQPEQVQFNYYYQPHGRVMTDADFERLGIAKDDRHIVTVTPSDIPALEALGFSVNPDGSVPTIYASPLTASMVNDLKAGGAMVMRMDAEPEQWLFPQGLDADRTRADYPGVYIPRKGDTLKIDQKAWLTYGRAIKNYEHNDDATFVDGKLYIGGKPQESYTFKMDYYFMMGDNRDNSLDSRYWGFVPEDHIVGRPELVLISFDKDKSLLNGGIRRDRVLTSAHKK